ncbi:hypothetical protein [uncultured Bacteroides sp.]|uniref:hypothetical protein n=1 Tax=uncultured Bacteroides sp. TaxID=162156 RepID=UPI002AA5E3B8|nr:hypothetical protein [uncultured Bacteroides sp.]
MKLNVVCLSCFFVCLAACKDNPKKIKSEQQRSDYEKTLDAMEKLQEKGLEDSAFQESKEYAKEMERTAIQASKKMNGMRENDKLLLEYETSLKILSACTSEANGHPELLKDLSFAEKLKMRTDRVREVYLKLKKTNLNPLEKRKFELLSGKK